MQAVTDDDTDQAGQGGQADHASSPRSRTPIVVGVLVAVVVLALGGIRIATLVDDRTSLREQVAQLEESLRIARGDAGAQIEQLEGEVAELTDQATALEGALATTVSDLDDARDEVEDLTGRLDERRAERDELQEQIDELQAIVDVTGTEVSEMPDLFGVPIDEVVELADELDVELIVVPVAPSNVIARPGDVIEQLPLEGTPLLPGSVVWVEVYTPGGN